MNLVNETCRLQIKISSMENFEFLIRLAKDELSCKDVHINFIGNNIIVTFLFSLTYINIVNDFVNSLSTQYPTLERIV